MQLKVSINQKNFSSNLSNNNSDWSSKRNPCPLCDDTKGKCGVGDPIVNCRTHVYDYSVGDRVREYFFTKLDRDSQLGVWKHESVWIDYSDKKHKQPKQPYKRVAKKPKAKKLTKCEAAKPDKAQHITDLRSLIVQLLPTKKAVDFLNERFGIKEDAKYWHSLGYFSVSGKEVTLTNPVPATVAGMKTNNPKKKSKVFCSAWGSAVNIPIADVHDNIIGHQPKNFGKNAPKYTWNKYEDSCSKSTINDSKVKQVDGSFESPMPVAQAGNDNKTIYVCEGTLKPLIAAHIHKRTFIGGASPLSAYPKQLRETLETLKPERVVIVPDAGAVANRNVCSSRIEGNIEALFAVRRQLDKKFDIAIADWGQLWGQEEIGDVDEINSKIFNRCNLIPALDWVYSESQITGKNHPFIGVITKYISNHPDRKAKSTRVKSLKTLRSGTLTPVNYLDDVSALQGLIEAAKISKVFLRFCLKEKLSAVECAAIASSLAYIRGGEKFYKSHLHNDYQTGKGCENNVQNFCSIIRKVGFNPCVMPDVDYSLYDLAKGRNILRLESPQTVTIEHSQSKLQESINEALKTNSNGVIAITVSTGVGKTHTLAQEEFYEYLKQHNLKVVILFATHKLLQEFQEVVQYPVLAQVELNLPPVLSKTINELYQFGLGREANELLFQCSANNPIISDYYGTGDLIQKELTEEVKQHIREHLDAKQQIKKGSNERVILATHSFFSLCPNCFEGRTVIADEDISKSYLRVSSASLNELALVARGCQPEYYGEILARLDTAKDNQVVDVSDLTAHLDPNTLLNFYQSKRSYQSTIPAVLNAAKVVKNGKKFSIIQHSLDLPDTKIVILSATPTKAILKQLAGGRLEVIEVGDTELFGSIYQIADRSYSRSCIRELDVNELQELTGDLPVITAIAHKNKFKNSSKTIHFGNTLGYNELKGQTIAIAGINQPSPADIISIFIASGGNIEGKDLRFKNQIVFYNGCRFPFNCFIDEELRKLQFELINNDLEQAVGRARLVRTDATVLVIAGFPLIQSQLITKDDWKEIHHELQATELNKLEVLTQTDRVTTKASLVLDKAEDILTKTVSGMDDKPREGCESEESEVQKQISNLGEIKAIRATEENVLTLVETFNFDEMDSELLQSILDAPGITQELIDAAWLRLSIDRQRYLTELLQNTRYIA